MMRDRLNTLTDLVVRKNVATNTQNQALNALVFLYSKVLNRSLKNLHEARSRKELRTPVALSVKEVNKVWEKLQGTNILMVQLLYGGGLQVFELVRLRVQDIDFEYSQITVRDGKGNKDRVTPLAQKVIPSFLLQTGTDIRTIQGLLGHSDLQTTIIYTHVLKQGGRGVVSPLDRL